MKNLAKRRRLTKKQQKRRNRWIVAIILSFIIFISGYIAGHRDLSFDYVQAKYEVAKINIEEYLNNLKLDNKLLKNKPRDNTDGISEIHIFDVGQGSSVLLMAKDGSNILIDTGRYDDSEKKILSYLDKEIGLGGKIDLLIFSHNDSDHIGHGDLVLEYFDVQEVWMNGIDHTTQVYSNLLDTLLDSKIEYKEPKAGENFTIHSFEVQVLHPEAGSTRKDHNDESIVVKISFDGVSLMTSGDTSIPRENEIVERAGNLTSDILVLGHHGADNSTGEQWIDAVSPKVAFYQAGEENIYNHPGTETIQRLEKVAIPVYGTDEFGTISLYINQNGEMEIETERKIEDEEN